MLEEAPTVDSTPGGAVGTPRGSIEAPRLGGRVGPYEIINELASGGMGVVYRARHEALRRDVALKVLLRTRWSDERARDRFQVEGRATARLRHPNIVGVHDVGLAGETPYLIMDLIEGESLAARVQREGPLHPREAARLLERLAAALDYAHEQQVLHRDVKPSNVLLYGGEPLLTDFGLAKVLDASSHAGRTKDGQPLGTPAYMSPEQARGEEQDRRSDVYSLGGTLYTLLTGEAPFGDLDTLGQVIYATCNVDVEPPSEIRGEPIDRDLETICLKCMEKDPSQRYESGRLLADDLTRYLRNESIVARPPSRFERARRWAVRNRTTTRVAAAALVAVAGLGISAVAYASRSRVEAAEETRLRLEHEASEVRRAEADRRRAEILEILRQAETGALAEKEDGLVGAVFLLARYSEPQTADLLAERLERVTERMIAVTRAVLLEAAQPDRIEISAGLEPLRRLEWAMDNGQEPGAGEIVQEAQRRLRQRAARGLEAGDLKPDLYALLSARHVRELGHELDVAKVACEALGRIGVNTPAVIQALGGYLQAESEDVRAVAAGRALARLGGPEALELIQGARARFGGNGTFTEQVRRELKHAAPITPALGPETAEGLAQRARLRNAQGDTAGAIADLTRALQLDSTRSVYWNNRGGIRLGEQDFSGAIADYDQSLKRDPKNLYSLTGRADARFATGDEAGALEDFARAIEIDPTYPRAWAGRGRLHLDSGRVSQALPDVERAVQLAPRNGEYLTRLARIQLSSARRAEAVETCERAIAVDPAYSRAWACRGQIRFENGDDTGALADASRAIELDPREVWGWDLRASIRSRQRDFEGALRDCERGIAVAYNPGRVLTTRGLIYDELGRLDEALADFDRALEVDPSLGGVHALRANVHDKQGRVEAALAGYARAIATMPTTASHYYNRAVTLAADGQLRRALADYDRTIDLDPTHASAHLNRGNVRKAVGDLAGALADYSRVIELQPENPVGWNSRATTRSQTGDMTGAVADAKRGLEVGPHHGFSWATRALVRQAQGEIGGAEADWSRAIALDPDTAQHWFNRGTFFLETKRYERAVADLEHCLELDPRGADAWNNLGSARHLQGKLGDAISAYTRLIEVDRRFATGYLNRARVLTEQGDLRRALTDYDTVLKLTPDAARAWERRGNVYRRMGKLKRSIPDFDRAIDLDPRNAEAWLGRARARGGLKDFAGAAADCSEVVRLDPEGPHGYYYRGMSRLEQGDAKGALADCNRAIELGSGSDLYEWRGRAYYALGQWTLAARDFERCVEIRSDRGGGESRDVLDLLARARKKNRSSAK